MAGAPVGAAPPATTPTPAAPERSNSATVADNDFIPKDVDLDDVHQRQPAARLREQGPQWLAAVPRSSWP